MRELSVYYCPKCGRYAYYHLPKNAVCPSCNCNMTILDIPYQKFMDLDYEERDHLISGTILNSLSSFVQRITYPEQKFNQREVIGKLSSKIAELEQENLQLNNTVNWMHETIWDLLRQRKSLLSELELLKNPHGKE